MKVYKFYGTAVWRSCYEARCYSHTNNTCMSSELLVWRKEVSCVPA